MTGLTHVASFIRELRFVDGFCMRAEDETATRQYVELSPRLYWQTRRRFGTLPKREVMLMVPDPDANFVTGAVNWSQRTREVVDWSTVSFALHDAFRSSAERPSIVNQLEQSTGVPRARIEFTLDNGATYAGVLTSRRGINRALPDVLMYIRTNLSDGPRQFLIRAEIVGGYVPRSRGLDGKTKLRAIKPRDLTYEIAVFHRTRLSARMSLSASLSPR